MILSVFGSRTRAMIVRSCGSKSPCAIPSESRMEPVRSGLLPKGKDSSILRRSGPKSCGFPPHECRRHCCIVLVKRGIPPRNPHTWPHLPNTDRLQEKSCGSVAVASDWIVRRFCCVDSRHFATESLMIRIARLIVVYHACRRRKRAVCAGRISFCPARWSRPLPRGPLWACGFGQEAAPEIHM